MSGSTHIISSHREQSWEEEYIPQIFVITSYQRGSDIIVAENTPTQVSVQLFQTLIETQTKGENIKKTFAVLIK